MKTIKNRSRQRSPSLRLLVLIPHRDARLPLRAWSASLFAAGFPGAWSFPWAAPLAQLKRPLASAELKALALTLRQYIAGAGGKYIAGPPASCVLPSGIWGDEQASLFGPELAPELPYRIYERIYDTIAHRISPLILGSALLNGNDPVPGGFLPPPRITFRAAALANMSYRPLPLPDGGQNSYSFEWRIGALHWLPRHSTPPSPGDGSGDDAHQ